MSDKRITEAWDWMEHDDGLCHMSRSKTGRWCEISHAQAVVRTLAQRLVAAEAAAARLEAIIRNYRRNLWVIIGDQDANPMTQEAFDAATEAAIAAAKEPKPAN